MTDDLNGEDTQNTNVMDKILENVMELCEQQRRQGDQIEEIRDKMREVEINVELIRKQQVNNGKTMAEMRQTCEERPFKCLASIASKGDVTEVL